MLSAVISLGVLGAIFGLILAVASQKFKVEVDERLAAIQEILPNANCGACGYPGCSGFAEAVCKGEVAVNACTPGGEEVAAAIADILGIKAEEKPERQIAHVMCQGGISNCGYKYEYEGLKDCNEAVKLFGGPKDCEYGCIGLGSCATSCSFNGIVMNEDGLPEISESLCVACGSCVKACPNELIELVKVSQKYLVKCKNTEKGKDAKSKCKVACIKCKICEKNCPEDAIKVVAHAGGSLAVIDYDKCTNCGICYEKCPTKAIGEYITSDKEIKTPKGKKDSACDTCPLSSGGGCGK